MENNIAVYGAYGHTGKFIVAALYHRGFKPLLCGRDQHQLEHLCRIYPDLLIAVADINDASSLDHAFSQAQLIINCAGPFLDTAEPIIQSAIRLRKHYFDLSAEQQSVLDVFEKYSDTAKELGISIIPAVAFYGGLGDLLSTHLTASWSRIDSINIFIGLSSWRPTKGTKLTGQRNHFTKVEWVEGKLEPMTPSSPFEKGFPHPLGTQAMIAVPLSEIITLSRHLNVQNIKTYINKHAIDDLRAETSEGPNSIDTKNRSSQIFNIQVVATSGDKIKTISAHGQDIYAVTAPLVVEAAIRILGNQQLVRGVTTLGQTFDVADFLKSLSGDDIEISGVVES
jgi:short subunit dehydrogenase-like uncharacterized protein